MHFRCYLLILAAFLLASCAHRVPKKEPAPVSATAVRITQVKKLTSFNQLDIQGQVYVSLHTGYKEPQVILKGDSRDLSDVKTLVSGQTLYIAVGKGYPHYGPIYADIRGQFLNRIVAKNTPIINGPQLRTSALDVYLENTDNVKLGGSIGLRVLDIKGKGLTQISGISSQNLQMNLQGSPKVGLAGVVNLSRLTMDGNAALSLYWIKTDNLIVRAKKKSTIQLAGIVKRLDVELWGNARYKGRYLRATRSFVKTHDRSVAEIAVSRYQSNLALDASDIYYFNLPTFRADFMGFSGSVLDMREWNQFELKDFTRYNKQFP